MSTGHCTVAWKIHQCTDIMALYGITSSLYGGNITPLYEMDTVILYGIDFVILYRIDVNLCMEKMLVCLEETSVYGRDIFSILL